MEQKSNAVNIVVVVITMVLILGAVYILNQSFSGRNRQTTSSSSSSISSSSRSSSSSLSSSSSSSSSEEIDEDEFDLEDDSSSSSNSSLSSSSSSSSTSGQLEAGQILATVSAKEGSNYTFDIKESTVEGSKFFTAGRKTKANISGQTFEVGKSYKISVQATDNAAGTGFTLNLFQKVEEVTV